MLYALIQLCRVNVLVFAQLSAAREVQCVQQ